MYLLVSYLFHQDLKRLFPPEKEFSADISDKSDNRYYIRLTLDSSENLIIQSDLNKDIEKEKISFTLKLFRTKHHRNGFVQYSFETKDIPEGHIEEFKIILAKDIYHVAKQFYHQHEADPGKDAALRAVFTEKEGGIDDDDNVFLISFLKNYAPVFEEYAKNISDANGQVQKREERISSIENNVKEAIENEEKEAISQQQLLPYKEGILEMALKINELCENACIEYTYCKTLLSSLHNKSFVHNLKIEGCKSSSLEEKKEWRRCALNIRNAMRYIENIKYKNQNRLSKLIQLLLNELNEITKEVNSNTHHIDLALQQGKRSESLNYILAYLSIYTSIVLSFPLKKFVPLDYALPYVGTSLGVLCNIIVFIGFLMFVCVFIWQKKRKIP